MSTVDPASTISQDTRVIDWGRYALVGLGTVVAAVVANVLIYFIGSTLVAYDPQFVVLSNVGPTIIFTVVPAIVAAVVLVASLIPDLTYIPTVPGATGAQTAVLMVMHVVAAIVIVWMLTTLTRPQSR